MLGQDTVPGDVDGTRILCKETELWMMSVTRSVLPCLSVAAR